MLIAFGQASDATLELIKGALGWPVLAINSLADLAGQGWLFQAAHDWLLGPALPLTAGMVAAAKAGVVLCTPRNRPLVDRIWPSAPDVLDPRLEINGARRSDAFAPDTPYVGREDELRHLMAFAGKRAGIRPVFMSLWGREGVGKTRIGLEWLKTLRSQGWDVGLLDVSASAADIRRAKFRRHTAVLIDEPSRREDLWQVLFALMSQEQRIRVLLTDQSRITVPRGLSDELRDKLSDCHHGHLRLRRMPDEEMLVLAPDLDLDAAKDADGRPLYALLGKNAAREISRRVATRLDHAQTERDQRALFLGALIGPVAHEKRSSVADTEVPITRLETLFEGEDRNVLKKTLPAIVPDVFADELVWQFAEERTDADLMSLVRDAIPINATGFERRLASLWRRGDQQGRREEIRHKMQLDFDRLFPNRHSELKTKAEDLLQQLNSAIISTHELNADSVDDFEDTLEEVRQLVEARSFDSNLQGVGAQAEAAAMRLFITTGQFDLFSEATDRLFGLLPGLSGNVEAARAVGAAFFDVCVYYAKEQNPEGFERWAAHLKALCSQWEMDETIQEMFAAIIHVASSLLGRMRRFEESERWIALLKPLQEAFPDSGVIQHVETVITQDNVGYYGFAQRFDDAERWADRLMQKVEDCGCEACQSNAAVGAVNALQAYGAVENFAGVERWGEVLWKIHGDANDKTRFDTSVIEATAYALSAYASEERFTDLERWVSKLESSVDVQDGSPSAQRLYVSVVREVAKAYGNAKRFDDLARWAERLLPFTSAVRDDALLPKRVATAFRTVIHEYGVAEQTRAVEFWGDKLMDLAKALPDDTEIAADLAGAVACALYHYGQRQCFDHVESWSRRLEDIRGLYGQNPKVVEEIASAAGRAIDAFGKGGDQYAQQRALWWEALDDIVQKFFYLEEVQDLAAHYGMTYEGISVA